MAITNGYATLSQLKTYLSTSTTNEDSRMESAIESASRAIDAECRRVFYSFSDVRYYQAEASDYIALPDDVLTITELACDRGNRNYVTLSVTDYELEPGHTPYTSIHQSPTSRQPFPTNRRGIRITGTFGHNTTGSYPDAINQACLILAVRFLKRRDAAFGVIGTPELGYTRIQAKDPEVRMLIQPYRRLDIYAC